MDSLDHLAGPAADLLGRVDELLTAVGAPDDHPIWPLLRRAGALPGAVLGEVVALQPAPLAAAGPALRTLSSGYDHARHPLTGGEPWQGAGAEAYAAHRDALATYLGGDGAESLTGRLDATASYADAVADWMVHTRHTLARTLAELLGSAEAVLVVTADHVAGPPAEPAAAAAEIGARVLATVEQARERAYAVLHRWAPELTGLPYPTPTGVGTGRFDTTTRVGG
ncbi:hypothetical protein ACI2K4_14135 [Micromonospora sp. NPDC050397]|uniref:hypothetical protein n=1 Tax=Micromonospora sp. NPDC050397 TaxID=3364279 RepID=UPI0038502ADC